VGRHIVRHGQDEGGYAVEGFTAVDSVGKGGREGGRDEYGFEQLDDMKRHVI